MAVNNVNNNQGGPEIVGEFVSMKTSKSIMAKGCIMDGERFLVLTDDGPIPMNDFSNEYIKYEDTHLYDEHGKIIGEANNKPIEKKSIEKKNKDLLFKGINIPTINKKKKLSSGVTDNNSSIISKVLDKVTSPNIVSSIEWENYPVEEFSFLIRVLDIDINDLIDEVIKKYCDIDLIINSLKDEMKQLINDKLTN